MEMPDQTPPREYSQLPVTSIAGISVCRTSLDEAVGIALSQALHRKPTPIRLVNTYSLALADKEQPYGALLRSNGANLPDGLPVAKAMNLLDSASPKASQVRGPSFFEECLDKGRSVGLKHYFLGGDEKTLEALKRNALSKYPGLEIAGSWSPPFRPLSDEERTTQDERIRESGAQIAWVGLGTPKQDFEAQRLVESLSIPVAAVGAGFDFLAGTKPVAPKWMQKFALEWVFRLISEPRRLWKRYLFGNVRFLYLVAREFRDRR